MKCVVYARRSSDSDDKQILSIDSQLDELRRFAAARGLRIDEEFAESASARSPGRPIFNEIMKRLRTGSVKGILVWSLDRLARNMVDGGALIYELSEGRLAEIITPEATYTNTGDAKFMLAMQFGAAAKYTDDLSDAVKRGNRKVVEMGKVPGSVPIGYLKTHEHELTPGAGTVVPDPERFDLVKRLWKEVASSNCSISSVWQKARDEWGLTTRPTGNVLAKPVSIANVYHLLRNPFYTGKVIRGDVAHQGEHAPMISEEEFERVQARFRKGAPAHPAHAHYLYSGLLHCGHCGRLLVGERHDKHGHTYLYYRCGRRRAGTYQCHAPAPREEEITEAIVRTFGHIRIQPDFRDWALQALEWWTGDDLTSPEHLVRKAKRALAKAEREMTTLTDLAVAGTITTEEYKVRRMNQLKRIEHLREALAEPLERLEAWRAVQEDATKDKLDLAQRFQGGDAVAKRKLVTRTASDIIVTNRKAHLVLRLPFVEPKEKTAGPTDSPASVSLQSGLPTA